MLKQKKVTGIGEGDGVRKEPKGVKLKKPEELSMEAQQELIDTEFAGVEEEEESEGICGC